MIFQHRYLETNLDVFSIRQFSGEISLEVITTEHGSIVMMFDKLDGIGVQIHVGLALFLLSQPNIPAAFSSRTLCDTFQRANLYETVEFLWGLLRYLLYTDICYAGGS
jgi:hypothetical protein